MRPPFNVPQLGAPVPYPHRGLLAQVPSLVGWSEPGAQVVSVRSRHVLLFMNPQLTRRHSPTHEQLQLDPRARSGESSRGQRALGAAMTHTPHTHTRHPQPTRDTGKAQSPPKSHGISPSRGPAPQPHRCSGCRREVENVGDTVPRTAAAGAALRRVSTHTCALWG